MLPPTPRQLDAENFILTFMQAHGFAPTLGQIGAALHTSEAAAHSLLSGLQRRGRIRRTPGVQRSIELLAHVEGRDLRKISTNGVLPPLDYSARNQ